MIRECLLRPGADVGLTFDLATFLCCLLLCSGGCRSADVPSSSAQPNIVIFLVDTLRADRLEAYGYAEATSPSIDALAEEGVVFQQANAAAPWTLPSVVSLLTCTLPCEHDVLVDGRRIDASLIPLAERFRALGYHTAALISNPYAGKMAGLDRGYDEIKLLTQSTDGLRFRQWLRRSPERPFFLYVHNVEPHDPYMTPGRVVKEFGLVSEEDRQSIEEISKRYRELTRVDFVDGKSIGTTDNGPQQLELMKRLTDLRVPYNRLYDASVRWADHHLGQVVDELKKKGQWENTLFVLVADHGEELGDHGGWQHDQSLYQELIHVPLIMRFPGKAYAGRLVEAPVSLVDLIPTLADYLGELSLATSCRGRSLLRLFGSSGQIEDASFRLLSVRHNLKKYYRPYKEARGNINLVLRQGKWKGIWNVEPGKLELYDLSNDPTEKEDLSSKESSRAELLHWQARSLYGSCVEKRRTAEGKDGGAELPEDVRRRLEALGYVNSPASSKTGQKKSDGARR